MKKFFFCAAVLMCSFPLVSSAQVRTPGNGNTNLQLFYDFGKDRQIVTTTMEGFYNDPWGNTFFFIDHDFTPLARAMDGTYVEVARCFNFWPESHFKGLSVQLEYNGGVYSRYNINHAFLAGLDLFLHSENYKNTFNFKVLYKYIIYDNYLTQTKFPVQLTAVWGFQDLFGLKGLRFSGFADFWGQEHNLYYNAAGETLDSPSSSSYVFISEPQLWYAALQSLGCPNFNIGGEVELAWNFGSTRGFTVRPCLGVKWVF